MIDIRQKYGKIYYCPWKNEFVVFDESIIRFYDLPPGIKTLEDYLKRAEALGGGFIDG